MARAEPVFIGLDLGGTKILGLLLDARAQVLQRTRRSTPTGGNDAVGTSVIAVADELVQSARELGRAVAGIAICSPGFIDPHGRVLDASNLGVLDLPLRALVEQALGIPTLVLHDVAAAALGEARFGAATIASHVAFCNIGTGIGAGLVFDGHLYRGSAGRAGELGHVIVERNGPACTCGKRGCLEALASGMAIVQQARAALAEQPHSAIMRRAGGALDQVRMELIAQVAADGDPFARSLLVRAAEHVGTVVAGLIHVLDLDCVVFGGGVAQIGELFLGPLCATVRELVFDVYQDIALPSSQLGTDAGAIGALAALLDRGSFEF